MRINGAVRFRQGTGSTIKTALMTFAGIVGTITLGATMSLPVMFLITLVTLVGLPATNHHRTGAIDSIRTSTLAIAVTITFNMLTTAEVDSAVLLIVAVGLLAVAKRYQVRTLSVIAFQLLLAWLGYSGEWGTLIGTVLVGTSLVYAHQHDEAGQLLGATGLAIILAQWILPYLANVNVVLAFALYCVYLGGLLLGTRGLQ
ncbi:hypothetical protein FC50_GL001413 [Lacticaseibacillus pantheris DSM 15945 = JCM 12539 = NBRC 106106]|uniref:Uncharacterized protein n=1 Tax=Lacticaseibacillus pantheris DSM 15945 = JCM 12539 = NBRC 106106 TaxID=1423783 RepID=A0A0R1TXV6_9LACO|nr:hypothetical protein [Lacticaseibacillus pantheris]KRL86006.1 hypothetical protein FC50_GL001413 [Lacticaseibacillus pantheris DSM 15945 = JCM 12539 = NBRC 106106]